MSTVFFTHTYVHLFSANFKHIFMNNISFRSKLFVILILKQFLLKFSIIFVFLKVLVIVHPNVLTMCRHRIIKPTSVVSRAGHTLSYKAENP